MNFIKKVFEGKIDESVHLQFQKFSKGEFREKAVIEAKKSKDKYSIKTSPEFANELVRSLAEKVGNSKVRISGAIISTSDLKGELEYKEVKQFQGVKRYLVDYESSGQEIINLIDKFPKNFFALSFSTPDGENVLKIKPKAPKSGKPGKGDEGPKADFCSLKTKDTEIGKSFVFENSNFKEAKIFHTFLINEIFIPDELKKEKDFAKVRELAKRKGKVIRKAVIDGKETISEKEFLA